MFSFSSFFCSKKIAVLKEKQQLYSPNRIGCNRAKIEIICSRDQNCKFTYVCSFRIEFKAQAERKWEHKNKREFNSHKL